MICTKPFNFKGLFFAPYLGMLLQIVGASVGAPNALDPAVAGATLRVPTVARVMRHLVGQVLAEAEAVRLDADGHQKHVDPPHEVAESFVGDGFLKS